jgi:hypothetical protein
MHTAAKEKESSLIRNRYHYVYRISMQNINNIFALALIRKESIAIILIFLKDSVSFSCYFYREISVDFK